MRVDSKENILKLLSDHRNISLLAVLNKSSLHVGELARLLGMGETHVSERLARLRNAKIVASKWKQIAPKKNVKTYSINFRAMEIEFGTRGLKVKFKKRPNSQRNGGAVDQQNTEFIIAVSSYRNTQIPQVKQLVGRKKELSRLNMKKGPVIVWGLPGIGKTSLVATYASTQSRPVFWHDFRQMDTFDHVLLKIAIFLNAAGKGELLDLIHSGSKDDRLKIDTVVRDLMRIRAVVVLDDYHHLISSDDGKMSLLISELLLPSSKEKLPKVILISRIWPSKLLLSSGSTSVCEIKLNGFNDEEIRDFVQSRGIELSVTAKSQQKKDAVVEFLELKRRTAGHPLALEIMCGHYGSSSRSLKYFEGESRDDSFLVEYLTNNLIASLEENESKILRACSVFREPVTMGTLRKISRVDHFLCSMSSLEKRGAVTRIGDSYAIHDLVREAAYKTLADSSEAEAKELHRKAAEYYLSKKDTRSTLEALYHLGSGGDREKVIEIIGNDTAFVGEGFLWPYMNVLEQISTTIKEVGGDDERVKGWIALGKGRVLQALETRLDEAIQLFKQAIGIARTQHDHALAARAFLYLGYTYKWKGDLDKALSAFHDGLKSTRIGRLDPFKAAVLMEGIIEILVWKGKYDEALDRQAEILSIYGKVRSKRDVLTTLANRGIIHLQKGEPEPAVQELSKAVKGLDRMGKKREAGITRLNLALANWDLEREEDAICVLGRAIRDLSLTSANALLMEAYATRAVLYTIRNDFRAAEKDIGEASRLSAVVERKLSLGILEMALGVVSMAVRGNHSEGMKHFDTSEELSSGDEWYLGRTIKWRGIMEGRIGNKEAALKYLNRAREIFAKLGSEKPLSNVESDLKRVSTLGSIEILSAA